MDEQHLNKDLFEGGKSPVPIPSVDRAWGGMEQLLNKELPILYPKVPANYGSWLGMKVLTVIITVSMSFFLKGDSKKTKNAYTMMEHVLADETKQVAGIPLNSLQAAGAQAGTYDTVSAASINANQQQSSATDENKQTSFPVNPFVTDHHTINPAIHNNKQSSFPPDPSVTDHHTINPTAHKNKQASFPVDLSVTDHHKISVAAHKNEHTSFTKKRTKSLSVKDLQELAVANKLHQLYQPSVHENEEKKSVKDLQELAAGNKLHQLYKPSSHENEEKKSSGLDLATLPLHKEEWKALTHSNMKVSVPPITAKPGKSNAWSLWLQLNVPIPLYDNKYYFTGPNGNNVFYRNLIPSLRLEKAIGRSALSVDLHPYNTTLLPIKKAPSSNDTTAITVKNMVKQFGPEMTLQYHYPVYENLHVSAGLGVSWWQKAIVEQTRDSVLSAPVVTVKGDNDWKRYTRFAFTANVEVYYDLPKWQMGLRAALPLNKYSSDPSRFVRKQPELELLLRRRICWPSIFSLHN